MKGERVGEGLWAEVRRACGKGGGLGRCNGRSLLNASAQFQLAEGRHQAVVGPLVVRQLQVPGPDHHHHVEPRLLGCFGLCSGNNV